MYFNTMFVSWKTPVRGREKQATRVFNEWVEMMGTWQSKGSIKSFMPVFLSPHGDLGGFFLVQGDPKTLQQVFESDELRRATARAQIIVDDFRVVRAITGDEISKQMALFNASADELGK
jgi:hypothetical protein